MMYGNKKKLKIFAILFLILLPLISATGDDSFFIPIAGDDEFLIGFGDSEFGIFWGQDFIKPVIKLESPLNNHEDTDGVSDFSFNVSDSNPINNCSLFLDYSLYETDTSITKGITQTFHIIAPPVIDDLVWWVNCTDRFNNVGGSQIWHLDTLEGYGTLPGGGGGTGIPPPINISSILCNLTYESAEAKYKHIKIEEIQDEYLNITNETVSWTKVHSYIDNWQGLCSDLMNKSLREPFVCSQIYDFIIEKDYELNLSGVNELKGRIDQGVSISIELLIYYIKNYDELCYLSGYSRKLEKIITDDIILPEEKKAYPFLIWFIIISLMILTISFLTYQNRKKMVVMIIAWKKKFEKRLR